MATGISRAKGGFGAGEGHRCCAQVIVVGIDDRLAIVIGQTVSVVTHHVGGVDPGRNGKAAGERVRPTGEGLPAGGHAAAAKKLNGSATGNRVRGEHLSRSPGAAAINIIPLAGRIQARIPAVVEGVVCNQSMTTRHGERWICARYESRLGVIHQFGPAYPVGEWMRQTIQRGRDGYPGRRIRFIGDFK